MTSLRDALGQVSAQERARAHLPLTIGSRYYKRIPARPSCVVTLNPPYLPEAELDKMLDALEDAVRADITFSGRAIPSSCEQWHAAIAPYYFFDADKAEWRLHLVERANGGLIEALIATCNRWPIGLPLARVPSCIAAVILAEALRYVGQDEPPREQLEHFEPRFLAKPVTAQQAAEESRKFNKRLKARERKRVQRDKPRAEEEAAQLATEHDSDIEGAVEEIIPREKSRLVIAKCGGKARVVDPRKVDNITEVFTAMHSE